MSAESRDDKEHKGPLRGARSEITHELVYDLVIRRRMRQVDVAKMLGTTKQNVAYHLRYKTKDDVKIPIAVARESLPWPNVLEEHRQSTPYHRALNHAEYMATRGRGMSRRKLELLRGWYKALTELDQVVAYDPTVPGRPGMKHGGWVYLPRDHRPIDAGGDGDLLLRVNEHTVMSDEAYDLWRLPPEEEWPKV